MLKTATEVNQNLYDYVVQISLRDDPVLQKLRKETEQLPMGLMQISADQGQFLYLLVKLLSAKNTIEVGTFTGYSSLCVARALPDDGKIIACDVSKEWTDIAQRYWQMAQMEHKIDLHLGPAMNTLNDLIKQNRQNQFDFAFIDADKDNQLHYYEFCLQLIRPGGLVCIDNIFWGGSVIDKKAQDEQTQAIREFNRFVYHDDRVDISTIAIGDGLTLARKK